MSSPHLPPTPTPTPRPLLTLLTHLFPLTPPAFLLSPLTHPFLPCHTTIIITLRLGLVQLVQAGGGPGRGLRGDGSD